LIEPFQTIVGFDNVNGIKRDRFGAIINHKCRTHRFALSQFNLAKIDRFYFFCAEKKSRILLLARSCAGRFAVATTISQPTPAPRATTPNNLGDKYVY